MTTYDNAGLPAGQQQNYDAPMQSGSSGILDFDYVKSLKGILKASEIVSIIDILCGVFRPKINI